MKCPHCQKEISESGFVYCPHCGKQLKPSPNKEKGIFRWGLVVWSFLIWVGLSAICFGLDKLEPAMELVYVPPPQSGQLISPFDQWEYALIPGNPLEWAPFAWVLIALAILYAISIWVIYQHAKRYNRNAVRWITIAIVFTPISAWIAYGLSWRKSQ